MNNEIKWIGIELPDLPHHRAGAGTMQLFVNELKKRPNEWALYREMPKGQRYHGGQRNQLMFPGTKWATRTIDGITHIYAKWVGNEQ